MKSLKISNQDKFRNILLDPDNKPPKTQILATDYTLNNEKLLVKFLETNLE